MAEARTEKFQAPSWPTLFAAATALSGVIWYLAPLSTSRPGGAAGPEQAARPGYQNVDARLWQDPLEPAIADVRAGDKAPVTHPRIQIELGPRSQQDKRHKPEALLQEQPDATELMVMPVMLETGPYADSVERRRRARNAVVSALHECHYVPDDSEHIGYITVEELAGLPDEDSKAERPAGAGVVIPFEWFRGQAGGSDYVVVLWLDEGSFQRHPLRRLRILLNRLGLPGAKGLPTTWSVKVIGPRGSTTLRSMVDDVANAAQPDAAFPAHDPLWARVELCCGTATAPDPFVLHWYKSKLPGCSSVAEALGSRGVCFVRTTDDDFDLARALVAELGRRGVKVYDTKGNGDLVAIVSESDTFYGRMLPLAFQAAACRCTRHELDSVLNSYSQELPLPHSNAARIHQFSYLRGIDGKLPGESDPKSAQPKPAGAEAALAARPHGSGAADEAPEGQNQYDYLRRLSDELARLDQDERAKHGYSPFKDGGLKAVGVLGSDLYDKLLVLQALRARFPDIVFFTTDVDARMGSPSERRWAHNLVIASSYGLALQQELQGEIPPFRDAYQTATYCAALRALGWEPPKSQSGKPCGPQLAAAQLDRQPISIFEVARSGLFDLAREAHPDLPYPTAAGVIDVTPQLKSATSDWWHRWHVGLLLVGALLLIVLILGLVFQMQWERLGLRSRPVPHPWALLLAAVFIVTFIFWETGAGFIQNAGVAPAQFSIWWFLIWGTLPVLAGVALWRENGWCPPQAWPWARIAGGTLAVFILALGLSLALRPQNTGATNSVFFQTLLIVACPIPGAVVLGQVLLAQASRPLAGEAGRSELGADSQARPTAPESDPSSPTTGGTGRCRFTRWRKALYSALAAARHAISAAFAHVARKVSDFLTLQSDRTTSLVAVLVSLAACWCVRHGLPHPWQAWLYLGFVAALALVPVSLVARVIWRQVRPRHEPLWPYLAGSLIVAIAICTLTQWDRRNDRFPLDLSNLSSVAGAIIPLALVAAMIAAAIVDVVRRPAKSSGPRKTDSKAPRLNLRPYFIVAAIVVITVTWAVTQNKVEGVPFAFFEGISLWPSEIIRGIAAVLALHFLLEGGRELVRVRRQLGSCKTDGYWLRGRRPQPHADRSTAAFLWRRYLRQCKPWKTVQRVAPTILLYFALAACLSFMLGLPRTPVRGTVSRQVDQYVLLAGVILLLILTVWVVDTTMAARRFIQRLSRAAVAWPDQLLKTVATKRGMSPDDLGDLLDVQFISRLTVPIMHLIYYPFIVLTLMIVARLNIFADWDWPPALLVIFVLNSAWAVYAAYLLRDAAEKARGKTLRRLREKLLQIQGTGQGPRVEKIKETICEIQSNRKGAFASFVQNPVIGAVLLPASAALLALLGNLAQSQ